MYRRRRKRISWLSKISALTDGGTTQSARQRLLCVPLWKKALQGRRQRPVSRDYPCTRREILIRLLPTASRPSEYIFAPLQILLQAARAVGPHRSQAASSSITGLLQAYEDEVVQNVYMTSDLTSTYVEQTRIDVTFLEGMLDAALGRKDQPSRWTAVSKRLSSLASTPSDPAHSAASQHALLRSQTLLAPLLPNLYTPTLSTEVGLSLLLPLGAPPTLAAADVKLDLAKPGARFALLPVNATAA